MLGIKGVARAAVVGVVALLSLFLAVDCAVAAQPVTPSAALSDVRVDRAEPTRDLCAGRRHDSRHAMLPAAASVPMQVARPGFASADADGADDDEVPDAITASGAVRHVVPLSRSGQLPVVLQVFRC